MFSNRLVRLFGCERLSDLFLINHLSARNNFTWRIARLNEIVYRDCAGEEQRELMRNEITDLRRAIGQEVFEKEAIQKTSNEMRNMVKKAESDKVELNRIIQDCKQKIAGW